MIIHIKLVNIHLTVTGDGAGWGRGIVKALKI